MRWRPVAEPIKTPDRPEHSPRDHEWLPDAYHRDVEPHGPEARELVRQALAEGDIKALLRTPVGELFDVAARMWRKDSLDQKVYPRFEGGRMRIRLGPSRSYVKGWVFVPLGSLRAVIEESQTKFTRSAQDKCAIWLRGMMKKGQKEKTKDKYAEEAFSKYQIPRRRFNNSWDEAAKTGDPYGWRKSGPVKQSS